MPQRTHNYSLTFGLVAISAVVILGLLISQPPKAADLAATPAGPASQNQPTSTTTLLQAARATNAASPIVAASAAATPVRGQPSGSNSPAVFSTRASEAATPSFTEAPPNPQQKASPTNSYGTQPGTGPAAPEQPTTLALSGTVLYAADFSSVANFQPQPLGEADGQLVAAGGQLACVPPEAGQGEGEWWIAPKDALQVESGVITVRLHTDGSAAGLIFDRGAAGAQLLRVSGDSSGTYLSTADWLANSPQASDGHLLTPTSPAVRANLPFPGWHTVQLTLSGSDYHAVVDGAASLDGRRKIVSGTVALYAVCDGVAFDTFTITK